MLLTRKSIRGCGYDPNCAVLVVRKVVGEEHTYYELWEGYHRVTVMRKLGREGWIFPKVEFIVIRSDCDQRNLYSYCFGIFFYEQFFCILILFIARNANNNNMVELTFSDKLLMFKKHYNEIVKKNNTKQRIRDRGCKKEELAWAVPVNIKACLKVT